LPGRVPDLQLYYLFVDLDCLGGELDSDGDVVLCVYLLLDELLHHARFSDSYVRGMGPVSPMTMNLKR
jgi:hypothetical protein